MPNLDCRGAESPGGCDVFPKISARDVMREQVCCRDEAANHQLPIALAFWIMRAVSTEECSSLMQNLMQICCSTCSVILNATATQYTCSLNGIYHPHWLVQWSHHCSHMCIAVHSPRLPSYIDVVSYKPLSSYQQWLDSFQTDLIYIHTHYVPQLCLCGYEDINTNYSSFQNYTTTLLEGWGGEANLCMARKGCGESELNQYLP